MAARSGAEVSHLVHLALLIANAIEFAYIYAKVNLLTYVQGE